MISNAVEKSKNDEGRGDANKHDVGKYDIGKSDASKSDASKSDANKSDANKSDASKSDASKNNAKSEQNIIGKIIVEPHLLKRVRFTNTQTQLNKLERFKNINDAFGVNEKRLKRYCSKKKRQK